MIDSSRIITHKKFSSSLLEKKRDIAVYLPKFYKAGKNYPVLYMHDGQNLFDFKKSKKKKYWNIDKISDRLTKEEIIEEIIIVGINSTKKRDEEYSDTKTGNNYLKFIVNELKPFIDEKYRTKKDRENTAIMGSSLGGLISFLAVWKHHKIFSKAACLSASFYFQKEKMIKKVNSYKGKKKNIHLYIDHGEDQILEGQKMFCALTKQKFRLGKDLDYFYEPGGEHAETAWERRSERPLIFLFGK